MAVVGNALSVLDSFIQPHYADEVPVTFQDVDIENQ
jgi:hypothetical protein